MSQKVSPQKRRNMKKTKNQHQNDQKTRELPPKDKTAQDFIKYFSHAWDFIESAIDPVQWRTERRYWLEPRTFWKNYLDTEMYLGVRFGDFTRYGMADVDRNSPYHPENDAKAFQLLLWAFEDIGLTRYIIVQSSYSEGIHIYFFFPEACNTFDVACALRKAVTEAGFKVAPGVLELFPNTKPYGDKKITLYNGHRLPLQHGSFLLDENLAPYSESIKELVHLMEMTAKGQDMEKFQKTLKTSRKWWSNYKKSRKKKRRPSNSAKRWKKDVEDRIKEGWTGYGQTNEMIKEIGKNGRVFLGLSGEALERYMVETCINCPGYKQYCRHQHEIWSRCKAWARIIEPYWVPLYDYPKRHESYKEVMEKGKTIAGSITNAMRHEDARGRIQKAVAHIIETVGELPSKVKQCIKLIQETTKKLFNIVVSEGTLRRIENLDFWHPKYRNQEEGQEQDNTVVQEEGQTNRRQPEKEPSENPDLGAELVDVVCKTSSEGKEVKSSGDKEQSDGRQTPPYMKGVCEPPQATEELNGKTEELRETEIREESENQVKEENKQQQNAENEQKPNPEKKLNSESENLENGKKPNYNLLLENLKQANKIIITIPEGKRVATTVEIKKIMYPQLRVIKNNTEVELLYPEHFHSQHPKKIYIKPLKGAEDWLGGIPVLIEWLKPVFINSFDSS